MINRLFVWAFVPVAIVGFSGCKKKQTKSEQPESPVAQQVDSGTDATGQSALGLDERAAMHGFARYLPEDTEMLFTVHNGTKAASRMMASKLASVIADEELGDSKQIEQSLTEGDPMGVAGILGNEFTVAIGNGGLDQLGKLVLLNRRSGYFGMRSKVQALANAMGDMQGQQGTSLMMMLMVGGPEAVIQTFVDPTQIPAGQPGGLDLLEQTQIPPVYIGMKVAAESRDAVAQQIAGFIQMTSGIGDMGEGASGPVPVEVKLGDASFAGNKIPGGVVAQMLNANRNDLEQIGVSKVDVDRLMTALTEKSLTIMSGVIGEYVVIFLGSTEDDFKLKQDVSESVLAGDAMAYADAYQDKDLLAVFYCEDDATKELAPYTTVLLADWAGGLRSGLADSDKFGDTRNLQALLRMVEEREALLLGLGKPAGSSVVSYFEDGFKLEVFGCHDNGSLAWDQANRLAPLGQSDEVAMFMNYSSDVVYDQKVREYVEAVMETVYAGARKAAELPLPGQEMSQFKAGVAMFEAKFRTDLVELWDAMGGGFGGGLGNERALVVDFKGEAPSIPGVPQELVAEAKVPRISLVSPVVDRSKLAAAWTQINGSLTKMVGSASELGGMPIPMQKPLSSEKAGFKSWFISVPFLNDDFVPSVTVGDEWFAASTSKNQAVDLLQQAAAGGEVSQGFHLGVDFKLIDTYSGELLEVLKKHMGDKGISSGDLEEMSRYAKALEDLDELKVWIRREGGQVRGSLHFKTR